MNELIRIGLWEVAGGALFGWKVATSVAAPQLLTRIAPLETTRPLTPQRRRGHWHSPASVTDYARVAEQRNISVSTIRQQSYGPGMDAREFMTNCLQSIPDLPIIPVTPGSSIAADSIDHIDVGATTRWALFFAIDTLKLLRDMNIAALPDNGYTGILATVRIALLTSCRSLWLLSPPSRVERRRRALWLYERQTREAKKIIDLQSDPPDPGHSARLITANELTANKLGATFVKETRNRPVGAFYINYTETDAIIHTANEISIAADEERSLIREAWMLSSAAAHGFPFHYEASTPVRQRLNTGLVDTKINWKIIATGIGFAHRALYTASTSYVQRAVPVTVPQPPVPAVPFAVVGDPTMWLKYRSV